MEHLSELFSTMNIDRPTLNLEFINFDPHKSSTPPFRVEHNDLYWYCQTVVISAICMYAFYFPLQKIQKVLYGYRRSNSSAEKAEAFLMKYDVPKHEIIKDDHYWFAIRWISSKFRPKWKIHPVHFTDLRWYPWKLQTNAERPFSIDPEIRETLINRKHAGLIPNAKPSFANLYTEIFIHARTILHQVKAGILHHTPDHIQLHVKPALVESDQPDKVHSPCHQHRLVRIRHASLLLHVARPHR
jgi:hypothetical protein